MKFVDEATIKVIAGNGGNGSASFRREKFVPFGGPDGGDGGRGGSIYFEATPHINTLIDFRTTRKFSASHGEAGKGRHCTGGSADDVVVEVPCGTLIYDEETEELLADLVETGQRVMVAKGGDGGLGNLHFKTSTNRSPRKTIPGQPGESRSLRLELKLLADVGLLGMPNAGKSTLIRSVSSAKPKVADYPFTTLHPNLGVVKVFTGESFVMADIPGLIEGAADGAGLGHQFLRHLSRTFLLLHLVEVAPLEGDAAIQVQQLARELGRFSDELAEKDRWLVFTKADTVSEEELKERVDAALKTLSWGTRPYFVISSLSGLGLDALKLAIMKAIKKPE